MKAFLKNNGLSVVLLLMFIFSFVGQVITGFNDYNSDLEEHHAKQFTMGEYLTSGHFIEATFENWESEFLQMGIYVILTIKLFQKGSSESKDPDANNDDEEDKVEVQKDSPWPVKKGGIALRIYQNSLTIVLFALFFLSFFLHFYGSLKNFNNEQIIKGLPIDTIKDYMGKSKFWFESFENWQSEFLSMFTIVVLSIYLRQKGSPQSKPVGAPHSQTGE